MKHEHKRRSNERKFPNWEEITGTGRKYWIDIKGRHGWKARYIKEVDEQEETKRFYQEIYDSNGKLVELHEKYPVDKRHKRIKEEK